jgi:hypothetical protein
MGQSVLRRVMSPLLTLTEDPPEFVMIPVESVVDVLVDLSRPDDLVEQGFHRVRYNDQELRAFTRDIRERTEPIMNICDVCKLRLSRSPSRIRVYRADKPV